MGSQSSGAKSRNTQLVLGIAEIPVQNIL